MSNHLVEKQLEYKRARREWRNHKARQQVDEVLGRLPTDEEEGLYYNIWYNKHCGFAHKKDRMRVAALTRCNLLRDSGITRGDQKPEAWFCLHFARGQCVRGHECFYKHHLPESADENILPVTHDCFGREKHKVEREDMGGVGSFNRECRTLYLGSFRNLYKVNLQELLFEHFSEWGDIEELKVFADRGFAFVRYKIGVHAQFAKEAMYCQSLGYNEILNVRWATDDPNPRVVREELERKQKRALVAMEEAGLMVHPETGYQLPSDYDLPEPDMKRRKVTESSEGTHLAFYPNTSQQFQQPVPAQIQGRYAAGFPPPPPPMGYGGFGGPPPPMPPPGFQGQQFFPPPGLPSGSRPPPPGSQEATGPSDALSSLASYSE